MKRIFLVKAGIAAAVLSVAFAQTARAALEIKLLAGAGATATIVDNGAGDTNPAVGQIQWSGSIGNFVAVITEGTSNAPGSGAGAILQTQSISIRDSGAAAANLTITMGDTGFTSPAGPGMILGSSFAGTFLSGTAGENVSFQSYVGTNNALFGTTVTSGLQSSTLLAGSPFPASFSTLDRTIPVTSGTPFSVTDVTTISLSAGGQANLAGTTVVTPASGATIPEPASLSLLGLGAVGLLARRRRA